MAEKAVYVVTGANRGLGLELVAQLLKTDSSTVVAATARAPEKASELQELAKQHGGRLKVYKLDASSDDSIKEAAQAVGKDFPDGIDVLWNNAGIQEPYTDALDTLPADFRDVLQVNTVAPLVATQTFLPLLKKRKTRKIVNTTSILGSIKLNHDVVFDQTRRGVYHSYLAYSSSKAALNMVTSTIANQLQAEGFTVVALHPGHVDTDMGSRDSDTIGKAPLTKPQSAEGQIHVVKSLTPKDTGRYLSWEGKNLPY